MPITQQTTPVPKSTYKKKYQRLKWATHLTEEDSRRASALLQFLYKKNVLGTQSKYALVQYCLKWAYLEMVKQFPNFEDELTEVDV